MIKTSAKRRTGIFPLVKEIMNAASKKKDDLDQLNRIDGFVAIFFCTIILPAPEPILMLPNMDQFFQHILSLLV